MPSLTPADRERLLGPLGEACTGCGFICVRHYCRSCDEFYVLCGCTAHYPDPHDEHRIYLWTPQGVKALPDFDL